MPIEKVPVIIIHIETVKMMKDLSSLGLYCYLLTLDNGTKYNPKAIMKHFNIDENEYKRILEALKEAKLINYDIWNGSTLKIHDIQAY